MKDLTQLNKYRLGKVQLLSISFYGEDERYNGVFRIRLKSSYRWFNVIATNGGGWDHVSVTPYHHTRTPTWDEMCEIKNLFFEPEEECVEFHPKKSEYINLSKHCLHLWRPNDGSELRNPIREAKIRLAADEEKFLERVEGGQSCEAIL